MLKTVAALACLGAAVLAGPPAQPPPPLTSLIAPPSMSVTVATDGHGSPGALVPVIVTLAGATRSTSADLEVDSPGVRATCVGAAWFNPVRRTLSRRCYGQLPGTRAVVRLAGRADVRVGGGTVVVRSTRAATYRPEGPDAGGRVSVGEAIAIDHCGNTTGDVWLTFDDAITPTQAARLLPVLARNHVRARFFLLGQWGRAYPGLRARIVAAGHVVLNHTADHPALTKLSDAGVRQEIRGGLFTRGRTRLLRPPYGAGAYSARIVRLARQQGYRLCRWTTDTSDWQEPGAAVIAERVRYGDATTPPVEAGGVILLHATHPASIGAVQRVIDTVRAKGLRFDGLP